LGNTNKKGVGGGRLCWGSHIDGDQCTYDKKISKETWDRWEEKGKLAKKKYREEFRKFYLEKERREKRIESRWNYLLRKRMKRKGKNKTNSQISNTYRSIILNHVKNRYWYNEKYFKNLVGCSVSFFKKYIESKWESGMSWKNHSLRGWHLDHIKPCASFDLNKKNNVKKCFHYTNYQPLWAKDNLSKGKK
jgi:hypothetical protein